MWELVARRTLLTLSVLLATFLGYLLFFRNADSVPSNRPLVPESIEQADAKIEEIIVVTKNYTDVPVSVGADCAVRASAFFFAAVS